MSDTQLTKVEKYQIQSFLKAGYTKQMIAEELGRHPSTIGRELSRNTGLRGYRPQQAQRHAEGRKQLHCHTLINHSTWQNVEHLLRNEWSTEQISDWLKKINYQSVSPQWIYHTMLNDPKAGGDLHAY